MRLQAPKGFKDYLTIDAQKRKFVLQKITKVYEKFGFDPLETPTLEYEETLIGKYGEEEKLIYRFETPGGDKVALRYDQTVPLARVIAQYGPNGQQQIPLPYKRYQIQSAFRAENTQKGRYREFNQCDADIVGVSNPLTDAELCALVYELYENIGLKVVLKVNDRQLLKGIDSKYLAAIDKLNKIGPQAVLDELVSKGLEENEAKNLFEKVQNMAPNENLNQIIDNFVSLGYPKDFIQFDPTLMRGLDYYTGLIMEAVLKSNPIGPSVGGGGRWDKMIGKFTGTDLPASGYSIGLDRTIEAMEEDGLVFPIKTSSKVLVTIFSPELVNKSLQVCRQLRLKNIPTEIWLDPDSKLDKQLKYADIKGIPYVVIIGPDEAKKELVTIKNLLNRTQETVSLDELPSKLSSLVKE